MLKSLHRHISNLPQTRGWEKKISEGPPCVILASPGMLQTGLSRELLELWAPDARNGLIVTGYSVEGTMARVSTCLIFPCLLLLVIHVHSFVNANHWFPLYTAWTMCDVSVQALYTPRELCSRSYMGYSGHTQRTRRDSITQREHDPTETIG